MRCLLALLVLFVAPTSAQFTSTARHIASGTTLPSTCNPATADIFSASGQPYYCSATNVWTLWTGSGGGGGGGTNPNLTTEISGCGVDWSSGTLTVTVGACVYLIAGVQHTSSLTNITLMAADMTNPRLDLIIVDNTGTASAIEGTASMTPVAPNADPATQLALSVVLVPANGTSPSGVTTTLLYDEDTGGPGEWTAAATAHFTLNSTNNPYHLTKDIEATAAVLGNNFTLTKPSAGTIDLATCNTLVFYIRSKAQWPTGNSGANAARFLTLWFSNGATQKGVQVIVKDGAWNFSSSITNGYQQISIPCSNFNANGMLVTTLNFNVAGNSGTSSIGFYIDLVTLQNGLGGVSGSSIATHAVTFVVNGQGSVPTTGDLKIFPIAEYACTINRVDVTADQSGSMTMDIWKRASRAIPTSSNKISASAPATLSSAQVSSDATLTGWTTSVAAGDVFGATLVTATTITSATVQIWCQ